MLIAPPTIPAVQAYRQGYTFGRVRDAFHRRIVKVANRLLCGSPKCLPLVRSVVKGKAGIEIGGPSTIFSNQRDLPIYDCVGTLDNCDFSSNTVWADHKPSFVFHEGTKPGQVFFCEGSDLREVPSGSYDFVLSSHNLEHFANPVKALKEWQRVLKPGGHLVVVLPYYRATFDYLRVPTPVRHMLEDFERNVTEEDQTHVEEVFESMKRGGPFDEKKEYEILLTNYQHRMMHHHVFDQENSRALLEAVGFKVLGQDLGPPHNIFLLAQML